MSPSPSKRRPIAPRHLPSDDEDEDEETLKLKLQAIEAKLKLKALQRAKSTADIKEAAGSGRSSQADTVSTSRSDAAAASRRADLSRPNADIQVPHSPVRNYRKPEEQKSPARVILGIDKGLTGRDVSLKRPGNSAYSGLSRTNLTKERELPKIKSFADRIADSRNKEKEREQVETKLEERRNRGFGLKNIEGLNPRPALSRNNSSLSLGSGATDSMPPPTAKSLNRTQSRSLHDLQNPSSSRPGSTLSSRSDNSKPSSSPRPSSGFGTTQIAAKYSEISQRDDSLEAPSFESFSGLHLKSREMQHNAVTRTLEGKTIMTHSLNC